MLEAFEHDVAPRPGGFGGDVGGAAATLDLIASIAPRLDPDGDVIAISLTIPNLRGRRPNYDQRSIARASTGNGTLCVRAEFEHVISNPAALRRVGPALIIEMPTMDQPTSGMAILRLVQAQNLAGDAAAMILVTREPRPRAWSRT